MKFIHYLPLLTVLAGLILIATGHESAGYRTAATGGALVILQILYIGWLLKHAVGEEGENDSF